GQIADGHQFVIAFAEAHEKTDRKLPKIADEIVRRQQQVWRKPLFRQHPGAIGQLPPNSTSSPKLLKNQ
ncbi:MAG: hypothetical protein V3R85_07630, partial [Alphaproteobacteria bacterium]